MFLLKQIRDESEEFDKFKNEELIRMQTHLRGMRILNRKIEIVIGYDLTKLD